MTRWWRAYDEAVDDPKLQKLPADLFRAWFNICCITSQNGGTLPGIDAIAFKLRCSEAKAQQIIDRLKVLILIDETDAGMTPHNWNGRQYKSDSNDPTNATRQKRYRERHRNGKSNGVTSVTITDPETEQNRTDNARAREIDSDFDGWYAAYPKHEARGQALKAYKTARKSTDAATLLAGAERAKAKYAGADPKYVPLPATWLNGQRWLDETPKTSLSRAQELYREGLV